MEIPILTEKIMPRYYYKESVPIHDAKLFLKSDLYGRICRDEIEFSNNSHLIGDLAYKLTSYCMVGFKNTGFLTERQQTFNFKLSQQQVIIENAFALLKVDAERLLQVVLNQRRKTTTWITWRMLSGKDLPYSY